MKISANRDRFGLKICLFYSPHTSLIILFLLGLTYHLLIILNPSSSLTLLYFHPYLITYSILMLCASTHICTYLAMPLPLLHLHLYYGVKLLIYKKKCYRLCLLICQITISLKILSDYVTWIKNNYTCIKKYSRYGRSWYLAGKMLIFVFFK